MGIKNSLYHKILCWDRFDRHYIIYIIAHPQTPQVRSFQRRSGIKSIGLVDLYCDFQLRACNGRDGL